VISFCFVAGWSTPPRSRAQDLDDLLENLAPALREDRASVDVPCASAAVSLRRIKAGSSASDAILVDRDRSRLFVGDATIYEAPHREDGHPSRRLRSGSDLSLVADRFNREGPLAAAALVGDFAVVVWDWKDQQLWLLRDHFGIKPLHYRSLADGVIVASDARQILAIDPGDKEIDAEMALDFLLGDYIHRGRSFFRSIRQVPPAHWIRLGPRSRQESRYWRSPRQLAPPRSWGECLEGWREHLRVAVRDRLISDFPVAAHLSGGLDSGTIVGAAHEIQSRRAVCPGLVTLSAVFPGLACDESAEIAAVLERTPLFDSRLWDGSDPAARGRQRMVLDFPGLRNGPSGASWRDVELVEEADARVVLTGTGGDEVSQAFGVFRDMMASGSFLDLWMELPAWTSWPLLRDHLWDGLKGLLPRRAFQQLRRPRTVRCVRPSWLGPELARIFPGAAEDRAALQGPISHLLFGLWETLNSTSVATGVHAVILTARQGGADARLPYLDIRLVEYVMSIPWSQRIPRGDLRRLQREGGAVFAPPTSMRRKKTTFETTIAHLTRPNLPFLREVLARRPWASGAFVAQDRARAFLEELELRDSEMLRWRDWRSLWKIAVLETWLSAIVDYDPARRRE
jgi:asparagine synthase (glutamine-hydrolysing)